MSKSFSYNDAHQYQSKMMKRYSLTGKYNKSMKKQREYWKTLGITVACHCFQNNLK